MNRFIKLKKIMKISLKTYRNRYVICMFCSVIYTIMALIYPSILSLIIDRGIAKKNIYNIVGYSFLFLVVGCMMIIFYYLQKVNFTKLSQKIVFDVREKLINKLMSVNYHFWSQHKAGDVIEVIQQDVGKVESLLTTMISDVIVNLCVAIGVSVYLLSIDWIIGSVLIILAIVFSLIQKKYGRIVKVFMGKLRAWQGDFAAYINDIINHVPTIQMIGQANDVEDKFGSMANSYKYRLIEQSKLMAKVQNISMFFSTIGIFFVLLIGSYQVFEGKMSIGILFSLTMYVQRLYNPIISLANTYISLKNVYPILDKILDVLETADEIKNGSMEKNIVGNIRFENMYFRYVEKSRYVLEGIDLNISAGKIVGIVGENGVGKTTILRLLSKLCIPSKGRILLDGIDISKFNTQFLWSQIGIMTQETYLPRGKINEILGINENNLPIAKRMLRELHLEIDKFPEGMESEIGGNASSISGGEAQKLAFIRLILEDKKMFILDEPTSALDLESEELMLEMICKYMKGRTCVIITHRPKLLDICDQVIEMC